MKRLALVTIVAGLLAAAPNLAQEKAKNPVVMMDTTRGKITIELFPDKAPVTVKNFLRYVNEKHYDNTIFDRVIPDFMIRGGGLDPGFKEKETRKAIKSESGNGLANKRGTVAMARAKDPDSASAMFFINTVDNPFLDRANAKDKVGYTVFGQVIGGMDVVDAISKVKTGTPQGEAVPVEPIVIKSVRRVESK